MILGSDKAYGFQANLNFYTRCLYSLMQFLAQYLLKNLLCV